MNPENIRKILNKGYLLKNEPMSKHTTFQTGGPARMFAVPFTESETASLLRYLHTNKIPHYIIGNGSNLLVSDDGYDGVIVQIGRTDGSDFVMVGYEETDRGVDFDAGAGCTMASLGSISKSLGCTGFEALSGIPGCIGGAVVMNAGCYGSEIGDLVKDVTVILPDGSVRTIPKEQLDFSYRHSLLDTGEYLVSRVHYVLPKGDPEKISALAQEYLEKRKEKQPLNFPSAGSTFKRPEGYFAGKLIEDSGLKGRQIGGAQVSEKHCGFIINKDKATSKDIYDLIRLVQKTVLEKTGVSLETEVKLLGEFNDEP